MFTSPNSGRHYIKCTRSSKKNDKRQVNGNLERDCIKNIMMHQVLYIVQLPNEGGDMHIM